MYLVETKSKKEMNGNEIDNWDSKEITTTPVEKIDGCACGYNDIFGEISGGTEAVSNEFPWMVRIVGGCAGGLWACLHSSCKAKSKLYCGPNGPTASIFYGIWIKQSGAMVFCIQCRQSFAKETFSYDEHLKS